MTTLSTAAPQLHRASRSEKYPWRVVTTLLHLFGLGLLAIPLGIVLGSMLFFGGVLSLIGIGVFILIAFCYAVFGIAWFERERLSGLYGVRLQPVQLIAVRPEPGLKAYVLAQGKRMLNRDMWLMMLSFTMNSLLGVVVIACLNWLMWSVYTLVQLQGIWMDFTNIAFDRVLSALFGVVVSVVLFVGLPLLHRMVSVVMFGAWARERELTAEVQQTQKQREGAVRAADVERTRIERDLHDGVQPRLVSVAMTLGIAQQEIDRDVAQTKQLITEAHTSTKAAITELRQLARGIHASVLDDRGLDAALSALAGRSHIPVVLDVRVTQRCCREAETAVYFAIAEALTNAAKHSRASECRVLVRTRESGELWARIEDNGVGGARPQPGGGLDGIEHRVLASGGTFRCESPVAGPTAVEVTVPCGS